MTTYGSFEQALRSAFLGDQTGVGHLEIATTSTSVRAFALGAGKVHGVAVRHFLSEWKRAKGNQLAFLKNGLRDVQRQGHLTAHEVVTLEQMVDTIDMAMDVSELSRQVQPIYQKLASDAATSICALVLAGVAVDSIKQADGIEPGSVEVRRFSNRAKTIVGADIVGAFIGFVLGTMLSGGNAGIGGVVAAGGAVVGSVGAAIVTT